MKKFFAANIDGRGRLIRGILGVILLIAGVILCWYNLLLAVVVMLYGGFCLFEAVRGWCIMRACGVKTRF